MWFEVVLQIPSAAAARSPHFLLNGHKSDA